MLAELHFDCGSNNDRGHCRQERYQRFQSSSIHGHGTGALKSRLRAYLAESPYVSDFRPGDPHRGGDGVTVITLED